jgi:hypothetical protein
MGDMMLSKKEANRRRWEYDAAIGNHGLRLWIKKGDLQAVLLYENTLQAVERTSIP